MTKIQYVFYWLDVCEYKVLFWNRDVVFVQDMQTGDYISQSMNSWFNQFAQLELHKKRQDENYKMKVEEVY